MEADKTGDEAHERLVLHQKDHWWLSLSPRRFLRTSPFALGEEIHFPKLFLPV